MLQLGPGSFEPGLPPELPKAQPKVPSPADSSVTSRPNEPCAPRPKNPPNRPPNGSTHRVSIPKQDPPRNSLSHLVRHQRDDHVNDFAGQAKGHRDGDFAIPGIRRALKLIEELVIHYGPSGGLGVPPPAKPPNSPPPKSKSATIKSSSKGGDRPPRPRSPSLPRPKARAIMSF